MDIREILVEYKEATINFINIVRDDYDRGQHFIQVREQCLEKLKELNINKEEFKAIYDELNIAQFDNEAIKILKIEKDNINSEVVKLKRNKQASQMYNNAFKNINFINRKI